MPHELEPFEPIGLTPASLEALLAEHERGTRPALDRLWSYYRNPLEPIAHAGPGRWYRQPQEDGLPARQRTDDPGGGGERADRARPVVENDIGWRIDALVDFVAGKPVRVRSVAPDAGLRSRVDRALEAVFEASGGAGLLQDATLLASVHGWVDLVLRTGGLLGGGVAARPAPPADAAELARRASALRVEIVEAPRAIPIVDPGDYRRLLGLVIRTTRRELRGGGGGDGARPARWRRAIARAGGSGAWSEREVVEILSAQRRRVLVDGEVTLDEPGALGELPVAHVQNLSQPFRYGGLSDVEPLIPLQDELNTRLSDRAHRVTMQSFKMYLAKGFELGRGASPRAVGPGQMWITDNPDASIEAFGGDGASPAEERHIDELREAMDKASSVSPVVLGVVRAKLGHLSSVNALRITMLGILSKTARKRLALGRGLSEVARLALAALDRAGVLATREADRAVEIEWPDPLPGAETDALHAALLKRELGADEERLRRGLGLSLRNDAID
jgi:hypothetical protein